MDTSYIDFLLVKVLLLMPINWKKMSNTSLPSHKSHFMEIAALLQRKPMESWLRHVRRFFYTKNKPHCKLKLVKFTTGSN